MLMLKRYLTIIIKVVQYSIARKKMFTTMSSTLLLRGFVVLGVMLMHTTWYFNSAQQRSWVTISEMLLDIISLFAVPLVMFVSGYVFTSHNRHADYYKLSFFRKMFFSVLSPYLLFSLIYIAGFCFFNDFAYTPREIAYQLITGSSAVHMAFFRALFGFYAIYPLLMHYFNRCRLQHKLDRFIIQVILLQILWKCCNNLGLTNPYAVALLDITTFLRYLAYFSFGLLACIYQKKLLRWIDQHHTLLNIGFLLNLPLIAVCWYFKYYAHSLRILEFVCFPLNLFLYTIIITMLFDYVHTLKSQDSFSKRFMIYLGNYSFGIFLIHVVYMYVGDKVLSLLGLSPQRGLFYPLLFLIMLGLSLLTMELLARVSWGHYFIGHVEHISLNKKA